MSERELPTRGIDADDQYSGVDFNDEDYGFKEEDKDELKVLFVAISSRSGNSTN